MYRDVDTYPEPSILEFSKGLSITKGETKQVKALLNNPAVTNYVPGTMYPYS